MIAFRDVVVRYLRTPAASRPAVDGVSLEAVRGRVTAVVGPNGSGKSTLVRALLGRMPLERGVIEVDGAAVADAERARRVAVVVQREEPAFPMAVPEYVALGRHPHLGLWRAAGPQDRQAVQRAMALAGVSALTDRRVDALSGGEWQRVRLARAFAQEGEAIVLDEPTTFLDVAHEMGVFELLHRVSRDQRQAVLLVSHQLNLVARFADHMVLLHHGRVAAQGSPDEVMRGAVLERVYEWPLVVTRDPAVGAPALVPLRMRQR